MLSTLLLPVNETHEQCVSCHIVLRKTCAEVNRRRRRGLSHILVQSSVEIHLRRCPGSHSVSFNAQQTLFSLTQERQENEKIGFCQSQSCKAEKKMLVASTFGTAGFETSHQLQNQSISVHNTQVMFLWNWNVFFGAFVDPFYFPMRTKHKYSVHDSSAETCWQNLLCNSCKL